MNESTISKIRMRLARAEAWAKVDTKESLYQLRQARQLMDVLDQ